MLFRTGDMTMQTKIKPVMSAMVFGVVVISGSASAQNPGVRAPICPTCGDYGNSYVTPGYYGNSHVTPGHRSPAPQHLEKKLPSSRVWFCGRSSRSRNIAARTSVRD
jgi:hypothetical protein